MKIFSKFFFFLIFQKNFRRNLLYDEYITYARMQNYTIIGQGVPEIWEVDGQTQDEDLFYRLWKNNKNNKNFKDVEGRAAWARA